MSKIEGSILFHVAPAESMDHTQKTHEVAPADLKTSCVQNHYIKGTTTAPRNQAENERPEKVGTNLVVTYRNSPKPYPTYVNPQWKP